MKMVKVLAKFGLDHCDLPTMLWNVGVLLGTLTINISRSYSQKFSFICYLTTIFSGVSYVYTYIYSMIWFVFVRCRETGEFISAITVFSITMCSVTCIPKMFYMKCYRNSITNLVEKWLQCNELMVKGTRFEKNFSGLLKVIKKQAMVVWIVLGTNGVVYVFVPFLRPGRHFPQDLFVLYGLEPMQESPNYEIATVLFLASSYFSLFVIGYLTIFIIVTVGFLEAQMLALSVELTNIWDDSEKFYNFFKYYDETLEDDTTKNIFITRRLRDIVKFHIMDINLRCEIENKLRFIFFIDFIFMVFAIVAELVGGLENTGIQMPFTFGMVFIDCYIGQRLIDASRTFEDAVYNCKWEKFNVSNQKTVLIMVQCSERTMTLSAGGMAVLDYPFLMAVLKSTYSAYTTIKSA